MKHNIRNQYKTENWEKVVNIIAWAFLIIVVILALGGCKVFKPYSGTCPTNDSKFFYKDHSKHYKYQ